MSEAFASAKNLFAETVSKLRDLEAEVSKKISILDRSHPITIGVCAMAKKANCKPMKEILGKLPTEEFKIVIFDQKMILDDPVSTWPICECLIAFYSNGFPLNKAIDYVDLRHPVLVNDLKSQRLLWNRHTVYQICEANHIPVPNHLVVYRGTGDSRDNSAEFIETDAYVQLGDRKLMKPFVEKPLDADDHGVFIYFPLGSGGGRKELFRKVGDRASEFYSDRNKVRREGSYLYEEFLSTEGTDVKVYSVTEDYAHAEARKSPVTDGRVMRDENQDEIRYPVVLSNEEKEMARKVVLGFHQNVCGFDMLRHTNGKSYVCDVNGWSFVKKSARYHKDSALMLANLVRKLMGRASVMGSVEEEENDTSGDDTDADRHHHRHEELRAVIAVIRHGDRTPKQKLKLKVLDARFLDLFEKFGNGKVKDELKLKTAKELGEVLLITQEILREGTLESKELDEFAKVQSVLNMNNGQFRGINRKVQLKRVSSEVAQLIVKWGGTLTPQGRERAEQLGRSFREKMYPGIDGLLRLHSTFRHDLKIYASDEGRVQVTAAAFTKGLLDLEGHLTPILETLVNKKPDINLLLHDASLASNQAKHAKDRVKYLLSTPEHFQSGFLPSSVKHAFDTLQEMNLTPQMAMKEVHESMALLVNQLKFFLRPAKKVTMSAAADAPPPSMTPSLLEEDHCDSVAASMGGENTEEEHKTDRGDGLVSIRDLFRLAHARWDKLYAEFLKEDGIFDVTKIPDIYDCAKYDITHNPEFTRLRPGNLLRIHKLSKLLADIVVPQEYGETPLDKFEIGLLTCQNLLHKIRDDLTLSLGGGEIDNSTTVFEETKSILTESEESPPVASSSAGSMSIRLDKKLAKSMGIKNANRHVRTRLYFSSESHLHAVLNVLRFAHMVNPSLPKPTDLALNRIQAMEELAYCCHIVIRMYEIQGKNEELGRHLVRIFVSDGFHVEVEEPGEGGDLIVRVGESKVQLHHPKHLLPASPMIQFVVSGFTEVLQLFDPHLLFLFMGSLRASPSPSHLQEKKSSPPRLKRFFSGRDMDEEGEEE